MDGGVSGQGSRKPKTNVTQHRSNHLVGDAGSVWLSTRGKTALPHLPDEVYEGFRGTASEFVTDQRDGRTFSCQLSLASCQWEIDFTTEGTENLVVCAVSEGDS